MPARTSDRVPSYRHHKPSNRAVVTLCGKDFWLGTYDTPESRQKYNRLVAEWLANGRALPVAPTDITVVELIARFWTHAETFYRHPDGTPTGEADNYRQALRPLKDLYGDTLAAEFGPRALRAVQHEMIKRGWARTHINKQVSRIKTVFRWAAERELIPGATYHALRAVVGLKAGRSEARETDPVKPVPEGFITPLREHLSRQVWAMIQVQLLTGCRPGEVVLMRAVDIDRDGKVWLFRPQRHKGQHHGHAREIRIGPKAQAIISPFFKPDLSAFIFSPEDAERERREKLTEARKTPTSCGNVPGSNIRRKPEREPADRYTVASYRRAIERACDDAFPPPAELQRIRVKSAKGKARTRWESVKEWRERLGKEKWAELRAWQDSHRWNPHQLRHNCATRLRREFGIDLAQTILGHRLGSAVTEIYSEVNGERADDVIAQIG